MRPATKANSTSSLHKQLVRMEKLYQLSLERDDQFSVLKGFKNIIKELKLKLEKLPPAAVNHHK